MRKRNLWWLAVMVLVGAGCATARAGETWKLLGQRAVEHRLDRDEIVVGADEGRFHQLQLRVRSAPVILRDVKVHFADGSVQDVAIRKRIPAGGEAGSSTSRAASAYSRRWSSGTTPPAAARAVRWSSSTAGSGEHWRGAGGPPE